MHLPGGNGVRVDTAAYDGFEISPYYDSMIAKIIVQGRNRTEAIAKMRTALEEMVVVGVNTNLDFQYAIMENETFRAGLADTGSSSSSLQAKCRDQRKEALWESKCRYPQSPKASTRVWEQMLHATPAEARHLIREGKFAAPTSGLCPGYAQANLIILPREQAYDFLLFAQRNPKPCPILEVTEVGERMTHICAKDCDVATDFPGYRIYKDGVMVDEVDNVVDYWRDDLVAFIIGCSFSFESELIEQASKCATTRRAATCPCTSPTWRASRPAP